MVGNSPRTAAYIGIYLCAFLSSAVNAQEDIKCTNSQDGKPVLNGSIIECTLRASFNDNGRLNTQTFNLVQRIEVSLNISLDSSPPALLTILKEESIKFPPQQISVAIVMGNNQTLPASMTTSPEFKKTGSTFCDLNFTEVSLNVTNFKSPNLPQWVSRGIEQIINSNQQIRGNILELGRNAVSKLRAKINCQG